MKILITIVVLIFAKNLYAQIWCPQGAQWHYRVNTLYYPYQDGYLELNRTGTLVVGGKNCMDISATYYGVVNTPTSGSTVINYPPIATYEQNKVIYRYNTVDNIFDTIANFNANIGDKWRSAKLAQAGSFPCPNPTPVVTVIDTGQVQINGIFLRKLKVTLQPVYSYTADIIEKIGGSVFLFPYYICASDAYTYGNFVCYKDNNFALYKPPGLTVPCTYSTVNVAENSAMFILEEYPNPVVDKLTILSLTDGNEFIFKFSNTLGQEMPTPPPLINGTKTVIDMSEFRSGVYILNMYRNGIRVASEKIIKV